MILIILGAVMILVGIYMIASPQTFLKVGVNPSPKLIGKVRRRGIFELIFGIVVLAIVFLV